MPAYVRFWSIRSERKRWEMGNEKYEKVLLCVLITSSSFLLFCAANHYYYLAAGKNVYNSTAGDREWSEWRRIVSCKESLKKTIIGFDKTTTALCFRIDTFARNGRVIFWHTSKVTHNNNRVNLKLPKLNSYLYWRWCLSVYQM